MNCPKCDGSQLEHFTIPVKDPKNLATESKLDLDRCGKCQGVWFDGGELQQAARTQAPINDSLKAFFGNI